MKTLTNQSGVEVLIPSHLQPVDVSDDTEEYKDLPIIDEEEPTLDQSTQKILPGLIESGNIFDSIQRLQDDLAIAIDSRYHRPTARNSQYIGSFINNLISNLGKLQNIDRSLFDGNNPISVQKLNSKVVLFEVLLEESIGLAYSVDKIKVISILRKFKQSSHSGDINSLLLILNTYIKYIKCVFETIKVNIAENFNSKQALTEEEIELKLKELSQVEA